MARRMSRDLRDRRDEILSERAGYYKILVNGQTEVVETSLPEARLAARRLLDEGIIGEGDEVNIRYSQVVEGVSGWHEPNIESYIVDGENLRLSYKKPTAKQYSLKREEMAAFLKEIEEESKRKYALVPLTDLDD